MNYKESADILKEIEKADRILINCHRGPDPDCIGSALAMKAVLEGMGKKVIIVSPTKLDRNVDYLEGFEEIVESSFDDIDFSDFDLFIALDSSNWDQVIGDSNNKPKIPIIVIDHHVLNTKYGQINLVDSKASSVGEMLYLIFEDWNIKISKETATALIASLVGDTGSFRYSNASSKTFRVAQKLMNLGADKDRAVLRIYQNHSENLIKLTSVALKNLKVEKEYKLAWIAIKYDDYEKFGKPDAIKELLASTFMQSISGTGIGIIMLEFEPNKLLASFRSRGDTVDVSKIAAELGGGGHKSASGAGFDLPFEEAVEKVLEVARRHAKKNK